MSESRKENPGKKESGTQPPTNPTDDPHRDKRDAGRLREYIGSVERLAESGPALLDTEWGRYTLEVLQYELRRSAGNAERFLYRFESDE